MYIKCIISNNSVNNNKHIERKEKKYYLQFTILSLSMSGKKNLHEGNILYFGLKVCKTFKVLVKLNPSKSQS